MDHQHVRVIEEQVLIALGAYALLAGKVTASRLPTTGMRRASNLARMPAWWAGLKLTSTL